VSLATIKRSKPISVPALKGQAASKQYVVESELKKNGRCEQENENQMRAIKKQTLQTAN
jgi:hypothetical protein